MVGELNLEPAPRALLALTQPEHAATQAVRRMARKSCSGSGRRNPNDDAWAPPGMSAITCKAGKSGPGRKSPTETLASEQGSPDGHQGTSSMPETSGFAVRAADERSFVKHGSDLCNTSGIVTRQGSVCIPK